jgi:excisionase family DNA binding protein
MTVRLLVGLDEAAELLGLSERTVHRLVADGQLPSLKVGRRRLFSLRRLEEWAETRAADLSSGNSRDGRQSA